MNGPGVMRKSHLVQCHACPLPSLDWNFSHRRRGAVKRHGLLEDSAPLMGHAAALPMTSPCSERQQIPEEQRKESGQSLTERRRGLGKSGNRGTWGQRHDPGVSFLSSPRATREKAWCRNAENSSRSLD